MKMFVYLILLNLFSIAFSTIIIPPPAKNGTQFNSALIFLQGANIRPKLYTQFSNKLQDTFNGNLWVALTEFPLELPEPVLVNSIVLDAIEKLKASGFPVSKDSQVFFGGHSLGGAVVQNYILNKDEVDKLPVKVAGLILEGAFITRSNRNKTPNLPILTLGGELDGLCRISRMAESFYFNQMNTDKNKNQFTIVVEGMNHYQFSGEGEPPSFVVKNDIKPEINDTVARERITTIINSFMQISLGRQTSLDIQIIQQNIATTTQLVQPIIDGFNLEGFYHFNPPCYEASTGENCTFGSTWTASAQGILADMSKNLDVADEFHIVYKIPELFPEIHNNCTGISTCILNVTTVSQAIYSLEDSFDTGLQPVAADEVRAKLMSKQAILFALTGQKYDFNSTDGMDACAKINKESLNWALKSAPLKTMQRYLNIGKSLVIGDDIGPLDVGPLWIWTPLAYEHKVDPNTQKQYVLLRSPTLKFPIDYIFKPVRGYHYCKLLSPARAIEWLYVDSLKP